MLYGFIHKYRLVIILFFLGIVLLGLWGYISSRSLTIFGIVCIPLITRINSNIKTSRLLLPTLVIVILTLLTPAKTILFIGASLLVLLFIESNWGRINHLPLFTLFIISPVFTYVSSVFGFPIRLGLSNFVGQSLNLFTDSYAEGNAIWFGGNQFIVDTACMGLNLTTTTLLFGILMMSFFESKYKKSYSFLSVSGVILVFFFLNVLANYFRIIGLVIFQIPPENELHGVFGLLTLLLYSLIPGYIILKFIKPTIGFEMQSDISKSIFSIQLKSIAPVLMMTLICFQLFVGTSKTIKSSKPDQIIPEAFSDMNVEALKLNVWKLETEKSLIYLKDLGSFFSSEHHPMLCWKGSGFKLSEIKLAHIENMDIYTGVLEEKNGRLFTAWWYSNGKQTTHEQLVWRYEMLKGEPNYYLINVSAESKEELNKAISNWKNQTSI